MQDYSYTSRSYAPQSTEGIILLRPEQISAQAPAKTTVQSRNSIIRLAASIQKYGVLEPIEVKSTTNCGVSTAYVLIDGERRLRAAILSGVERIPCRILPEGHRKCVLCGILQQLKQESLHFFEQAAAMQMLMQDFSLTQEEIARKTGFSQSAIANKLRLSAFSKEEQGQIRAADLTERHARALLRLKEPEARKEAFLRVREGRLKVAATENMVEIMLKSAQDAPHAPSRPGTECTESTLPTPKPRKFALQSLTPLYNSVKRSLEIFQKTGIPASLERRELENSTQIIIEIQTAPQSPLE